jgi:RNA polymerase primary sigma factor
MRSRSVTGQTGLQYYLWEINETPLLSLEEERDLADRVAEGDPEARDLMVRANLRLVVNIARNYMGKGLNLEDLIEEGNLGLMRAVEGFDTAMSVRFSTYASYWIKQSIRRAVMNQGKAIRLPAYMVTLLSKWRRASAILADRLGRPPTNEEVGRALRLTAKKVGIVDKALRVNNLSLQVESAGEDGMVLDEVLTDERSRAPDDLMVEADELARVFDRMDQLDPREREVIQLRYGIGVDSPLTLREIGERLNLTRERVRQLEQQARRKLGDHDEAD